MAKRSMVLQLKNTSQSQPEGVTLEDDNTWRSPPGGWLPVQSGVWDQLPDGVHLREKPASDQIALLLGLNFLTTGQGGKGSARYPTLGETGSWTVLEIVDLK